MANPPTLVHRVGQASGSIPLGTTTKFLKKMEARELLRFVQGRKERFKAHERSLEIKHGRLDQISMLSGEGSKLREEINQTKGKISELELLEKFITGEL